MRRSVSIREAAEQDIVHAVDWYESRASGAGLRLVEEIRVGLHALADGFDGSPHPHVSDVRRLLLRRFPYGIVFVADEARVEVLALEHLRRRPGYWRSNG